MDRLPPVLYHATPSGNVESILRSGIVPRDESGAVGSDGVHPNRVFLSRFADPSYMNLPADKVAGAVLLAVDTSRIDPSRLYPDDSLYAAYFNDQLEDEEIRTMFPDHHRRWAESGLAASESFGEWMDDNGPANDEIEPILAGRFGLTLWGSRLDAGLELGEVGYEGRIPPEAISVHKAVASRAARRVELTENDYGGVSAFVVGEDGERVEDAYGDIHMGPPSEFQGDEAERDHFHGDEPIEEDGPVAILTGIELPPDLRGAGLGREMVEGMARWAFARGARAVYTHAAGSPGDPDPAGFYGALGFRDVGMDPLGNLYMKLDRPGRQAARRLGAETLAIARLRLADSYFDFGHGDDDEVDFWWFGDGRLRARRGRGPDSHDDLFPDLGGLVAHGRVMGARGTAAFQPEATDREKRGAVAALIDRFPGVRFTAWDGSWMQGGMTLQQLWRSVSRAASREPAFLRRLREADALPAPGDASAALSAVMSGTLIHNAAGSAGGDAGAKVKSILESGIDPARWVKPGPGQGWSRHPKAAYLSLAWEGAAESPPPNYVLAEPALSRPLVMWGFDADGNYVWGEALADAAGRTGQALSSLLRRHGYDSVVTVRRDTGEVGEIAYFGERPLPAFLPEPDRIASALSAAASGVRRAAVEDIFRGVKTVIDKYGGHGLFARFSDVPKIGIRPSTEHHDPYGVYFYPVDWLAENADFGTTYVNLPYITVARIRRSGWLNLATVRPARARELAEKGGVLEEYEARSSGKGLNQAKGGRAGKRLWDAVEAKVNPFESDSNKMEWNRIFGRMGVKAIYDPGTGAVNTREPSQIVVLDLSLIEVVDVVENREDRKSVFHAVLKAVADEVLDEGWRVAGSHAEGGIWASGAVGGDPVEMSVLPAKGGFEMEVTVSYHDPSGKKRRIVSRGRLPNEWEDAPAGYLAENHARTLGRELGEVELGDAPDDDEDATDALDAALRSLTNLRLPDIQVEEGEGAVTFWKNQGDGKIEGSLKILPGGRRELELYSELWMFGSHLDADWVFQIGPMRVSWEGEPSSAAPAMTAEVARAAREVKVTEDGKPAPVAEGADISGIVRQRVLNSMFPEEILAGIPVSVTAAREAAGGRRSPAAHPGEPSAPLRAWHGTSDAYLPLIREAGGLDSPFLAATPELAEYYADVVAEDDGGEPIVIEVTVRDTSKLRYDGAAMDELVTVGVGEGARDAEWGRAEAEHPEWVHGGMISIPPEEWGYSWRGAHSVWHDGLVSLADLGGIDGGIDDIAEPSPPPAPQPSGLSGFHQGPDGVWRSDDERRASSGSPEAPGCPHGDYRPVRFAPGGVRMPARIPEEIRAEVAEILAGACACERCQRDRGAAPGALRTAALRVQMFCTPVRAEVQALWDAMMDGTAPESGGPWTTEEFADQAAADARLGELSSGGYVGWRLASAPLEMVESEAPARAAALRDMHGRARGEFLRWAAGNDADEDSYWFAEWLEGEHGVSVRDDGLVEFETLDDGTRAVVGGLPVVVYHHTSDAVLPSVRREGLRADTGADASRWGEECLGVYVTTEAAGRPADGYLSRACAVHGGSPATLEVRTTLSALAPDENDADIASGARQFVLPGVPPGDILDGLPRLASVEGWHGTDADFGEFDLAHARGQLGFHFGTEGQAAAVLGEDGDPRIIRAELDIGNPLRMPDLGGWQGHAAKAAFEEALGVRIPGSGSAESIVRAVKAAGHDGIVYANRFEGEGDSYIAFDPSQIRIVDDGRPAPGPVEGVPRFVTFDEMGRLSRVAESAAALRAVGVEVSGGNAVLYRGTDVPGLTADDLRYGDFLSSVPTGTDATGNLGADSYGAHVERYEIPVAHVGITNGELQYRGPSRSLAGGRYPEAVYRAYNDANGSNFAAAEIDAMPPAEVRGTASMAMPGGREEFDGLVRAASSDPVPRELTIGPGAREYPPGTRRIGRDGKVDVLEELPIASVPLTEGNTVYQARVDELAADPPAERPVVERSADGSLAIDDGHHRILADRQNGKATTLAWVRDLVVQPGLTPAWRAERSGRGTMADAMPGGTYFFPDRAMAELWAGDRGEVAEWRLDLSGASVQDVPEGEMTRLDPATGGLHGAIVRRDPDGSGAVLEIAVFDPSLARPAGREARALGEHLGDTVTAYRALGAEHMEKVIREGFTGEHHRSGVYYTANRERAMFYARFMPRGRWGVVFELEADTSRSTADMNDATPAQSDELMEEVRSAASDMADAVERNSGARLWDTDAARQVEAWLGSLTVSEGYYDGIPDQHSVWQLLADETDMTVAEAREALPPGRYGEMTVLDGRGVAGIDAGEIPEQAQAVSSAGVGPERLTAVWLPSGLLEAAGEGIPAGAETMADHADVIPCKLDAEYDTDLGDEIARQRDAARERCEGDPPPGVAEADEEAWYADQEAVADALDGILNADHTTMPGHIYSMLDAGEEVAAADLDREERLVRYPLPGGRLAAVKAVRKALAADAAGEAGAESGAAVGRAARRAARRVANKTARGADMGTDDALARALRRAAEDIDWADDEGGSVDTQDFQDEGFVQDESGHEFWGSKGSGCLFVRNHPDEGPQLLAVLRSPHVEEPNTWGTTGGAVPKGETNDFASALRETQEEVGSVPQYKPVRKYVWKATGGTFTYTTFILECLDMDWLPHTFNWEATAARWVSLEEAPSLDLHFGLSAILDDLGEGIFPDVAE